jgi:hypothetical protein
MRFSVADGSAVSIRPGCENGGTLFSREGVPPSVSVGGLSRSLPKEVAAL